MQGIPTCLPAFVSTYGYLHFVDFPTLRLLYCEIQDVPQKMGDILLITHFLILSFYHVTSVLSVPKKLPLWRVSARYFFDVAVLIPQHLCDLSQSEPPHVPQIHHLGGQIPCLQYLIV